MSVAVIFHCFYFDLIDEFLGYFSKIGMPFSLFVTMPSDVYTKEEVDKAYKKILDAYPTATVILCKNFGADIVPCFVVMDYLRRKNLHFDKYVKVHTKKSLRKKDKNIGERWRKVLCDAIFTDFQTNMKLPGLVASKKRSVPFNCIRRDKFLFWYYQKLFAFYEYELPKDSTQYSIGTMFIIDGVFWEDFFFNRIPSHRIDLKLLSYHYILESFERLWEFLPLFYGGKLNLI